MTMIILMHDIISNLDISYSVVYHPGDLTHIIYIDDTLLLVSSDHHLQEFLSKIADLGRLDEMELYWNKFQFFEIQYWISILTPTDERLEMKSGIDYLGSIFSHDDLAGHELHRRIGMTKAIFFNCKKYGIILHS